MGEKICSIYASYEHLITILNSYIKKEKTSEIITIFDKDLSFIAAKIKNIDKKISWEKCEIEKIEKYNDLKNKLIIVVGKNGYIKKVNRILDKSEEYNKIINCYYIFENEIKIKEIIKEYNNILTTQGIEKISNNLIYN